MIQFLFSHLKQLIQRFGTAHIFWASDFYNFAEVVSAMYSDIASITSYHHFMARGDLTEWSQYKRQVYISHLFIGYFADFFAIRFPISILNSFGTMEFCGKVTFAAAVHPTHSLYTFSYSGWHQIQLDYSPRSLLHTLQSTREYPIALGQKKIEQLSKVYETCLKPYDFLPILITEENKKRFIGSGHISQQFCTSSEG